MKTLPRSDALRQLSRIRETLRSVVSRDYEPRARDCLTCETRECCTDEHFVNVRVTRLEAEAIKQAIEDLPEETRTRVLERGTAAARRLAETHGFFSCPLFEPEAGCLVHGTAKPLPCIFHACYERPEDIPADAILEGAEREVARLNSRTFGNAWSVDPIPVAIARAESKES